MANSNKKCKIKSKLYEYKKVNNKDEYPKNGVRDPYPKNRQYPYVQYFGPFYHCHECISNNISQGDNYITARSKCLLTAAC
jgi:hypothetical protein